MASSDDVAAILDAHWSACVAGDKEAADICLKVLDLEMRRLGVDKIRR